MHGRVVVHIVVQCPYELIMHHHDFRVEKYWLDNKCTDRVEREKNRLKNDTTANGSILRWNIFDLFGNIKWHSKDMDCSHFCYVPTLYDNVFERLELLLAPSVSEFKDNTNTGMNYF